MMTPASQTEQKKSYERDGDWACQRCKNLNFSFRNACNKCNLSHDASDNMSAIYKKDVVGYKLSATPFTPKR